MADQDISRKLAVIVHADVAGSTALVQRDETLAHKRINAAFQRFSSIIQDYDGTVHEIRGDALVAGFARASDAVCAALRFQQSDTEHNAQLDDDIVPVVRIGIALGEEVFADDTVTGAGVVLAQRVEQLSEPGGVCVTGAIHEAIPQRLPFDQESLGEQAVKGFEEPVRVYRVVLKPGELIPPPETSTQTQPPSQPRRLIVAFAAVAFVVAGGVAFWLKPWAPTIEPASVERMALPLPDKPSIAVLPFSNMSDDPTQEYFVDGMTEDLITDLSKLSGLFVIARNSSFAYKGKSPDVRQVSRELGVKYVLEGSVRRAGEQVRINAQLIDATSGGHVWAERYDGDLQDVFDLQDRITRKIVTALAVELTEGQQATTAKRGTNSVEAYDLFMKGWSLYRTDTPQGFIEAIPYFEKAITLDPDYGRAYAALASVYYVGHRRNWRRSFQVLPNFPKYPDDEAAFISRAFENLDKSLRTPNPLAYVLESETLLHKPDHSEAMVAAEEAIALDPNGPDGYVQLARVLTMAGQPDDAVVLVERAMRLNPHYPPSYLAVLGLAHFGLEDYERAASLTEQAIKLSPYLNPLPLIASLGYLDEKEKAAPVIENLRQRLNEHLPGYPATIRVLVHWRFPLFKHSTDRERLSEGLRRAGLS